MRAITAKQQDAFLIVFATLPSNARDPPGRAALAEKYAAHAINALAEARRVGYFREPSNIANFRSDPDLDPLRPRVDFQIFGGAVRFLRGRVRFGGADFRAPSPSAVVVFRNAMSRYEMAT